MCKELIKIVDRIKAMEEDRKNSVYIEEFNIEFGEITLYTPKDESMKNLLQFAYHLTMNFECIVHLVTKNDEVIVMLNKKYFPDKGVKIIVY